MSYIRHSESELRSQNNRIATATEAITQIVTPISHLSRTAGFACVDHVSLNSPKEKPTIEAVARLTEQEKVRLDQLGEAFKNADEALAANT